MTIKETKVMYYNDLRDFCCRNVYFTKGSNEDYKRLLNLTKRKITPKLLYIMAEMIFEYSILDIVYDDKKEVIENIMFGLSRIVYSTFEIIE